PLRPPLSTLFPYTTLFRSGSALGFGVGPLLITKNPLLAQLLSSFAGQELPAEYHNLKVGIPGQYTTANFLLGLAFPQLKNKEIIDRKSTRLNSSHVKISYA